MAVAGVEQIDTDHHHFNFVGAYQRNAAVDPITIAVTANTAVTAVAISAIGVGIVGIVVFAHLAQATLQLHVGANQQIAGLAVTRWTQAALVQSVADRVGQLRRFSQGTAGRQLAVLPGPAAVAAKIPGWRGVSAGVEGSGRLRRGRRQRAGTGDIGVAALAPCQDHVQQAQGQTVRHVTLPA
ncbi:hypothetical protein D3C77_588150 [compost metagenome]